MRTKFIVAYVKLREQVHELSNSQRSDTFIKLLQEAVRSGRIDGIYLAERFTMPKLGAVTTRTRRTCAR
ncbi:hypothetical protein J2Y00_004568 [Deinococcus soli (ex Cha et al. 2016)]|uniref:Uncharacterized protein n=2 Tax=Deinococcus soli (ex Cha et al. 2016) TaxID=1309411 RepID=A0AAE3XI15_9DEIO|nr:hypothetical protein [Deinococcus soli (ex Cha et al. 2016)]MDR6330930.1 hypothetical protein [Deinococcus soli (ex Cha et al. 2016)]MDR6753659.1 hypothetical protein [Deinococcus soli (ex Cha et al. 2016)]